MDPLQIGVLVSSNKRVGAVLSARPDAPVVPDARRRVAGATTRGRLASGLHLVADGLARLADAVAPKGAGCQTG